MNIKRLKQWLQNAKTSNDQTQIFVDGEDWWWCFPVIKEPDYLVNGEYRVDKGAAPKMLNCLMYKLCYYRFGGYEF
ncbi:hypothetical protein K1719_011102 [Acacia pycnantha]|nr:hypothetical protein K1719_040128 [Acacia pycnantha]KAI9117960.1 hypothetical protein K1719_011102 [Acacia pycnantha]